MQRVAMGAVLAIVAGLAAVTARPQTTRIPVAQLPFTAAIQAGPTLYVSGQIPLRPDGTVESGTVAEQTRQVMDNLGRTLKEHGYAFGDIVSVTVYLKDMKDYSEMNRAYATYFTDGFPTRACVGGLQIAFDATLEVACIAYKERATVQ